MRHPLAAVAFALLSLTLAPSARAELAPLIPRHVLFGESRQSRPRLSPDGHWLSWVELGPDGRRGLWIRALDRDTSWQVPQRGAPGGFWAPDSKHLLYLADQGGNENAHLFALELATGSVRDLTPFQNVRVEGLTVDAHHPEAVLVGLNLRDPRVFDLYRVNLATGDTTLDTVNPGDVLDWTTDLDFRVRACVALRAGDVATVIRVRDSDRGPWRDLVSWPFQAAGPDRSRKIIGFLDDHTLLVQMWGGPGTASLVTMDTRDGRVTATLAHDPRCDLWSLYDGTGDNAAVLLSGDHRRVLAAGFQLEKPEWRALDPSVKPDLDALARLRPGEAFAFVSESLDGQRWVVRFFGDRDPGHFVLWDRRTRRPATLFDAAPELARYTLAEMKPITFRTSDGLMLHGYLTLPPGVAPHHLPLIQVPHGGPWFRDDWAFDPYVQLLANRGYAVLEVEFRGSTGYGNALVQAGDHEFGPGRVLQDLTDGLRWTIAQGIADPKRIGIMGASFGGYATLCGLAFTPDLYACGVDVVGPSDVATLFRSFPAYWGPRKQRWILRFGDVERDSALNARLSPLEHAGDMRAPLLVGHGANDPRVKRVASDRIVAALRERHVPVDYVVYPDEGHGFGRPENVEDFNGRVETFLAKYLGGRAEPWHEVQGATAELH